MHAVSSKEQLVLNDKWVGNEYTASNVKHH